MKVLKDLRKGQNIYNFLSWLHSDKGLYALPGTTLADPFNISDEDWDSYYEEYLEFYEKQSA